MRTDPSKMSRRLAMAPQLGLLASVLLLTGCQTLSGYLPFNKKPQTASDPATQLPTDITKHEFELGGDQAMVGQLAAIESRENDTLPDIARHFGLGYNDITLANAGIDPWTPRANTRVLLPLQFIVPDVPRKGIVLNLANMRMFYFPKKERGKVYTYPVGIGRDGWNTPMGVTSIAVKTANPEWHVPPSIHKEHAAKGHFLPNVVRSGPENPLGLYAMRLAIGSYLIHGTNKPYGIGMQISHGCVQMYPEDIEELFKKASVGMQVKIIHQPYLSAWNGNMLYLEANEPLDKWSSSKRNLQKQAKKDLRILAKQHHAEVDWNKVDKVLAQSNGIPTPVLNNSPELAEISKDALQLAHPGNLYGQYQVKTLDKNDWAMLVATFKNENDARKLAAMLNHQGPPIPSRKVEADSGYHVIAGPFETKKAAKEAASRIRFDFEIEAKLLEPGKPKETTNNEKLTQL